MGLNYTVYYYDGSRNAVVMTDMNGKELAIDCDRAEAQVMFDEPEDASSELFYEQHYHCSQAVFAAFVERLGLSEEQALKIGGCFGGGMNGGEVCGRATGALMALVYVVIYWDMTLEMQRILN